MAKRRPKGSLLEEIERPPSERMDAAGLTEKHLFLRLKQLTNAKTTKPEKIDGDLRGKELALGCKLLAATSEQSLVAVTYWDNTKRLDAVIHAFGLRGMVPVQKTQATLNGNVNVTVIDRVQTPEKTKGKGRGE